MIQPKPTPRLGNVSRDLRHSDAYQSYAGVLLAPLSSTCLNSASGLQLEECVTSVPSLAHLATSNRLAVTDKGEQLLLSLGRRLDTGQVYLATCMR